ncbi:unnamed protein product [Calypogeia fissa]
MDFAASSNLEQQVPYPSMEASTRIAVVGGGPSGLSAAYQLLKLGYKNVTVLEQNGKVGGMCGSELIEGRVYDLGGQVIARESSPTVVSIMNQLGVELEEMGHHTMSRIDCDTGQMEEMKIVADCLALLPVTSKLQAQANETGKLGVHAVSKLTSALAPDYLKSNSTAKGVPKAVAALFTASGYGYPQDMPYAYIHEFVRSSLGQAWRVKGGYNSFWEKVANLLPDVRCNVQVRGIQRSGNMVQISVMDSSALANTYPDNAAEPQEQMLEFDKVVMSGSVSIPRGNRIYRSSDSSKPELETLSGILDYSHEELELFSKVETIDYYTTVLKISGLDIPAVFYYPEHADDPASMGRFVAMQRFYVDTDIFLFWSYGTAEVNQRRVTELLYEDVEKMGGRVETLILQRKWRYFPHIRSPDMKAGFYDKLEELQGKNNTYYTGALMAFELTERNTSFSTGLINKCFGSATEPFFVKRLVEYPLPNGVEEILNYQPNDLTELPGMEFPDLPTVDAYLSFYANHPVTKDRLVYTWLDNDGKESYKLTFSQLETRTCIIARHLLTSRKPALQPGDRVVLLHPPGLEFIEAFLACLRARILAVPLIPPDPTKKGGDQALEKLINVVKITNARAIISTRTYHSVVRASSISLSKAAKLKWPDLPWIHSNCLNDSGSRVSTPNVSSFSWALQLQKAASELAATSLGLSTCPWAASQRTTQRDDLSGSPSEQGNSSDQETTYDRHAEKLKLNSRSKNGTTNEIKSYAYGATEAPKSELNDVCFLQFTSGSTGDAKGVMITHGALAHNTKSMRSAYKTTSSTVAVSWLPQYHDMGLIGSLLVSLVTGGSLIIFSPINFIRKPMMWLETVEKYKATHTAAPNFGFELVLKRYEMLKASGRAKALDLSSLRFLMVGAEPICSKTMRGFVETFWDAGVREQIFAPGFGMAENGVFICCAFGRNRPMLMDSDGRVCCGYTDESRGAKGVRAGTNPHSGQIQAEQWKDSASDVRIVNPDTLEEVGDGVEGEIWLSSPSNGMGYWEMPEATKQTFRAQLKGCSSEDGDILFVRSGDLGRVIEGNLFVTGRIKDLIIVNGRNYYPSDIEKTVENCSNSLKPGCSAAFSAPARVLQSKGVVTSEKDGIVVVVEVRDENKMRKDIVDDLVSQIKAIVSDQHGLQVAFVNLIKPHTIPKTTSGKIRRRECLKRFSEGTLSSVKGLANLSMIRANSILHHRRHTQITPSPYQSPAQVVRSNSTKTKEEITSFLIQLVVEMTGLSKSQIKIVDSFENFSIDSKGTVAAASKLSEYLGTHVSAIQIYTTGCISELADLCEDLVKKLNSRVDGKVVSSTTSSVVKSLDHTTTLTLPSSSKQAMSGMEQAPITNTHQVEYEDDVDEISGAQLADALEPSPTRMMAITALQVLGILYMGALLITPAIYIYENLTEIIAPGDLRTSLPRIVLLSTVLVPLAWILYIATIGPIIATFGAKLLLPLNRKSQPSVIPLWSLSYVRWWTLYRLQDFASNSLARYLRGTVFLSYWYRSLGAEIGENVLLDTVDITDPALLSVGSGAVIGEGATIHSHEVNSGLVIMQSIRIGKGCVVGPYAVVQRGSILDPGSKISALGKTAIGERFFSSTGQGQQVKHKSPPLTMMIAQLSGLYLVGLVSTVSALVAYTAFQWLAAHVELVTDISLRNAVIESAHLGYLIFPLLLTFPKYLMILAPLMMFPDQALLVNLLLHIARERNVIVLLAISGVAYAIYGATLALTTCVLKWSLIARLQEESLLESSSDSGNFKYRLWLVHSLLRSAHDKFMNLLMGTEVLCMYLRSLGANVGRMASIRRLNALVDPDLLDLGEECHLGDFSKIVTSQHFPGGVFSLGAVKIGARSVVGAQSIVMPGATLQDRAVLGAMSVAPTGDILEEGGVYVGVKTPKRIFQQQPSNISAHGKNSKDVGSKEIDRNDLSVEDEEHPLVAVGKDLDPRFRQMIASISVELFKKTPQGHPRYIHYLGSSGKGTMRVLDNLPCGFPKHDILSPGATYPIILRCSNAISKDDDRATDVRGGTLRLLQPDSPDDLNKPLLDLFMKTGAIFHARNMVDFLGYYIMSDAERDERIRQFPALGESQWGNLRNPNSYAEMHYFCCTARHFQALPSASSVNSSMPDKMYVKFKMRPVDTAFGEDAGSVKPKEGELPPITGMYPAAEDDTRSKTFLRDDFKNRLESAEGLRFILQLQLRPIPNSTKEREEVEDCTKVWDEKVYPYMDVAELCFNKSIDDTLFDDIHFNPKYGPPSLAMIRATSAMASSSVDTGRSIMHDLLGYLRSGTPLPPLWNDLVKKSMTVDLAPAKTPAAPHQVIEEAGVPPARCPVMGSNQASKPLQQYGQPVVNDLHYQIDKSKSALASVDQGDKRTGILNSKKTLQAWELSFMHFIQPILQVVTPIAFLTLSLYPSLMALGVVGTNAGKQWMYRLLPVGFFCASILCASLGILCKWVLSWKIIDGQTQELWSRETLRHTVWDVLNQTMATTFLDLGKGSAFCTWYLQGLGASIKDSSVYLDTFHAMNPDQLQVGGRSAIGHNALLFGHLYEGEKVVFKSNFVGDDTVIGTRALLLPGLKMEDGAQLDALGLGMKDEIIRADFQY